MTTIKLLILLPALVFICNTSGLAQNNLSAFKGTEVKISDSWLKSRENLNTAYLYQLDPERLLHNFRVNAGIPSSAQPLEGWESPQCGLRGHFTGHYLSACAMLISRYNDPVLKKRLDYMVDVLSQCQQKLGGKYLSAFPEADFDTLEKKYGEVWAPYYTYHKVMQGLLNVYDATGNKKSLDMVIQMADYVRIRMEKLPEQEIEKILFTAQGNPSNEAGGMNEVLHNLYADTKDPAHLKLASLFDRKWLSEPLSRGKDVLSGLHSNTHIALVNGFARRYENTHDQYYCDAVVNFWDMLLHHHCYANGSSSGPRPIATTPTSRIAEHWGMADHLSATLTGEIAESCVTHNTQRLSADLFRWTASPVYADAYFNTFYNAVLPTQNMDNGSVVYHLPLGSPRTKLFLKESDFRCCNGSAIEAFASLNTNIYFHNDSNIWVNLFIPSELNWSQKGVVLTQTTNFPEEPKTAIKISCRRKTAFSLNLLIPSWAAGETKILVNGKPVNATVKSASFVTISREWTSGDVVELEFAYKFWLKSMPDNPNVIACFYGPVMLAFETSRELILKGDQESVLKSLSKDNGAMSFQLKNNSEVYKLLPFYKVTGQSYGVYATIRNEY